MSTHFFGEGNIGSVPEFREFPGGNNEPSRLLRLNVYFDNPVPKRDGTFEDRGGFWAPVELWHRDANGQMHRIGYLAAKVDRGGPQSSLKVSAVVRFRADGDENNTSLTKYAPSVQQRGWGYTVLVSGRLR